VSDVVGLAFAFAAGHGSGRRAVRAPSTAGEVVDLLKLSADLVDDLRIAPLAGSACDTSGILILITQP
jgi:hypothetical protein